MLHRLLLKTGLPVSCSSREMTPAVGHRLQGRKIPSASGAEKKTFLAIL
jgi:hypothetical protein